MAVSVLVFLLLTETSLAWKASSAYVAPLYQGEGVGWRHLHREDILKGESLVCRFVLYLVSVQSRLTQLQPVKMISML